MLSDTYALLQVLKKELVCQKFVHFKNETNCSIYSYEVGQCQGDSMGVHIPKRRWELWDCSQAEEGIYLGFKIFHIAFNFQDLLKKSTKCLFQFRLDLAFHI